MFAIRIMKKFHEYTNKKRKRSDFHWRKECACVDSVVKMVTQDEVAKQRSNTRNELLLSNFKVFYQ